VAFCPKVMRLWADLHLICSSISEMDLVTQGPTMASKSGQIRLFDRHPLLEGVETKVHNYRHRKTKRI
jgi:hypothetical protein